MYETAPIPFDVAPPPFPAPIRTPGLAARLAGRWGLWRERRRWIAELGQAAAVDRLGDLLNDVGLTRADLEFLIDAPADAGRQFEALARAEGADLRRLDPEALRGALWVCAHCQCRAPCKRWLRSGRWDHDSDQRCPNAALLRH